MPHERLLTTTIGAYPKPSCTPIGDWFPDLHDTGAGAEGEGLLKRWQRADCEQRLAQARQLVPTTGRHRQSGRPSLSLS